jgi:hypothetical protein
VWSCCQVHAEGCYEYARELLRREGIPEHEVVEYRRDRRHEEEQCGHLAHGAAPQQQKEQRKAAEGVDHDQPAEARAERRGPIEAQTLHSGKGQQQRPCSQVLNGESAAHVHAQAETLLVHRAHADSEESDENREVGRDWCALAATDAFADCERDPGKADSEADPLQRAHRVAEA